jgi:hypothetical protein
MKLDYAYLDDDIQAIRDAFPYEANKIAGFLGRGGYGERVGIIGMPDWAELSFRVDASAHDYIKHLLSHHACIDLRGNGDKSLRFIEAVIFNRVTIGKKQISPYLPPLVDGHNAILVKNWSDLSTRVNLPAWKIMAANATKDYLSHWSQLAQFKMILERAKHGPYSLRV